MNENLIPLANLVACEIRDVKQPGIVLPLSKHDEHMLLIDWEGQMHGIMLTGNHAFAFFPIDQQHSHVGLFVPKPEILVDVSSAAKAMNHWEDKGSLLLERDRLSVIGIRAGNGFADPQPVPLWQTVEGGSANAKLAFTRWGIGIREGDGFRTLWERQVTTKATVETFESA